MKDEIEKINFQGYNTAIKDIAGLKDYTFDGHDELEVQLVDAMTKQQLDRVLVKKNNDRDLGGLF